MSARLFTLKWPSALELSHAQKIGSFVGFRPDIGYIFRVNFVKCANLSHENYEELLSKFGIKLTEKEKQFIESLRGYDAFIYLKGPDLVLEVKNERRVEDLLRAGIINKEPRYGTLRVLPSNLWNLKRRLRSKGLRVKLGFRLDFKVNVRITPSFKLRDYQMEAYERWKKAGYRGVIVLPVAAGKTFIGIKAISDLQLKTLVLVPTIDLLRQWANVIQSRLNLPNSHIGVFGGGRKELRDITVMTYDSARIYAERIIKKFGLIIADECHHAVSPGYSRVFRLSMAPYRLGLTATPFRSDALHKLYPQIIGAIVYEVKPKALQIKGYLATYEERKIYVKLSPKEYSEYKKLMKVYMDYCKRMFPHIKDPRERFKAVLKRAAIDREARDALRARHKARQIALSTERKLELVEKLLKKYSNEKVLLFSRYTDIIRELSRRFFIPKILHDTPKNERETLLKLFREGKVTKLATAMALDEGIDVPDASVAIVISGTGSNREYIQRLGRILRPKEKKAILIEIITKGTIDYDLAYRRRRQEIFEEKV